MPLDYIDLNSPLSSKVSAPLVLRFVSLLLSVISRVILTVMDDSHVDDCKDQPSQVSPRGLEGGMGNQYRDRPCGCTCSRVCTQLTIGCASNIVDPSNTMGTIFCYKYAHSFLPVLSRFLLVS